MIKRNQVMVVSAAFAIIAAAALFLFTWEKRQHLGKPGVRVINVPMQGIDESASGTNRFVAGAHSIDLPEKVLSYTSRLSPITKLVWDWLPKDTTYGHRVYTDTNGFQIQTMAVLMGRDRTSIHQPQYCLTGAGWQIASQENAVIAVAAAPPFELPVVKMKLRKTYRGRDNHEREIAGVLVYWFVGDGQITSNIRQMMWWMARDLLNKGVLQRWAYITQFSVCAPGQEEQAYVRMAEFIGASVPEYQFVPVGDADAARLAQAAEITD